MIRVQPTTGARDIRLRQGVIRYLDRGRGEPIVFVHGFMTNADLWRKVVPGLVGDYRCITPDWPFGSHPYPMNADTDLTSSGLVRLLLDFVRELGLDGVTLVGGDIGGAVCKAAAALHPERVSRLVLLPSGAFPPLVFHYLKWGGNVSGITNATTYYMRRRRLLSNAFGWAVKRPIDPKVSESYVRPAMYEEAIRRDIVKLLKGISIKHDLAVDGKLRYFQSPALIAWPPEDRLFPFEHAVELAGLLPNGRLEAIEDSFTYVSEDQPERLVGLLSAFMHEPVAYAQHMSTAST